MRMDQGAELTAERVVNEYPVPDLARVLFEYGEEKFARRIAEAIARERAREPITGTLRLSAIVKDAIPAAARRTGGNPAKRTFQALRIEVNDELGALRRALPAALDLLAPGGRLRGAGLPLARGPAGQAGARPRARRTRPRPGCRSARATCWRAAPRFRLLTRGAERPDDAGAGRQPEIGVRPPARGRAPQGGCRTVKRSRPG